MPDPPSPRRLIWSTNHQTLLRTEVPLLRTLGWEVFVPKIWPDDDPAFRSGQSSSEFDEGLQLPRDELTLLNDHDFYSDAWSPQLEEVINRRFEIVMGHLTIYTMALSEAARKFHGQVVARAFGREHPRTYAELAAASERPQLLDEFAALGERFVFAQGYRNLAEIEPDPLRAQAKTAGLTLPALVTSAAHSWRGNGTRAVFLCPRIDPATYYGQIYRDIKRDFGDLPHLIFGKQLSAIDDPAVLPTLDDSELIELYRGAPVFVYPSREPRHVHYSPIEAMCVGTPVLYFRGTLLDAISEGSGSEGACTTTAEMRAKAQQLIAGDTALARRIIRDNARVLEAFDDAAARVEWADLLTGTLRPREVPRRRRLRRLTRR
jgi:hypothetical protein